MPGRPPIGEAFGQVLRRRTVPDPKDSLLLVCARPQMPEALIPEVTRRAALVTDWDFLLTLAEEHGVGPLVAAHLTKGRVDVPLQVTRTLRGLTARHRRCNEVMLGALGEILDVFSDARLESMVLKGPAIAASVYGDIGLRPISDLDLLVTERDAVPALRVLGKIGYDVDLPASECRIGRHHHLHAATRTIDGVPIIIEIHRDALSADRGEAMTFDDQRGQATTFDVDGRKALTLEPHEMLWHLCRHMVGLWHPYRLMWVADIIGYAERFVDELDWPYMRKMHPFVLSTLSLMHDVTPLPESLLRQTGVSVGGLRRHVCEDYRGWPRATVLVCDGWARRLEFLSRTIRPPDWWLRLNYGLGTTPMRAWVGSCPVDKTKPSRMVQSHFGEGVITWNIPFLFRTSPGYNLLVRGPSNWIKDGVQALEGIVETDWAVQTFTMNWKFTRPRRWVRFEADEPICMVVPQRRGELESFLTRLTPLDRSPELNEAFTEWSRSRDRFQVISKLKGSQANEQQWEKHYFRGQAPGLEQTSEDHQVGLSLRPFLQDDERRDES